MTGFKKYSKSEWMESLSLDKGIVFTHLVDPQIKGLSFAHQDDLRDYQGFERLKNGSADWKISCLLEISDYSTQNPLIPLSLEHGVEQIRLHFKNKPSLDSIKVQLINVLTDVVDIFISWDDMIIEDVVKIKNEINTNYFSNHLIKLEICIDHLLKTAKSKNEQDLLQNETLLYCFNFGVYETEKWQVNLNNLHENLINFNFSKPLKVVVKVDFDNDFLTNISSFRALKEVLKSFNFIDPVYYLSFVDKKNYTDLNSNLIHLSLTSLSASLANADAIWVKPADSFHSENSEFWLKLALHQQHILKQEAKMNLVWDPLGGSYYIEDLSNKIFNLLFIKN